MTIKNKTVDRFGRTVAEVIGGVNINLALVEDGPRPRWHRLVPAVDPPDPQSTTARQPLQRIAL